MATTTKTKRTVSCSVTISETITPSGAPKFVYQHRTLKQGVNQKLPTGSGHSQDISANTTWDLSALVHPSGQTRSYIGKKLKSLTVFSNEFGLNVNRFVTITGPWVGTLRVIPGGFFYQPFDLVIGAAATMVFTTIGDWTAIAEFE